MATYEEKVQAVLDNTFIPEWKILISNYFENRNEARESVLDVMYADLGRIKCVTGRPLLQSIIRDFSFLGWDENSFEPDPPFTSINSEWTNSEIFKYVWLKGDSTDFWSYRKVCDVGCGTGTSTLITHKLGSINTVYELMDESCMIACLNFILHDYDIVFRKELAGIDTIDMSYDTYIMARVFYGDFANKNLDLARYLKNSGKEVLIASKSLVEGTNPYATLSPSEYEMLLDIPIPSDPEGYGNRYVIRLV